MAVYLEKAAKTSVTGFVSTAGSTTDRGGIAMEKVAFAPGETCKVVTAPILGDKNPSTTNSTSAITSVPTRPGS